jgi:hypothetical protein
MAKKMGKSEMGGKDKPQNDRSKPNPSLRKGTGTMDMAKAMLKGPKKKSRKDEY